MKLLFFMWIISSFIGISHAQDCNIKFNEIRTLSDEAERVWNRENRKYEEIYLTLTDYNVGGGAFPQTVTVDMDVESNCRETEKVMVLMEIFPQEGDAPPYDDDQADDPCVINFNDNEGRRKYAVEAIYNKEIEGDVDNGKKH